MNATCSLLRSLYISPHEATRPRQYIGAKRPVVTSFANTHPGLKQVGWAHPLNPRQSPDTRAAEPFIPVSTAAPANPPWLRHYLFPTSVCPIYNNVYLQKIVRRHKSVLFTKVFPYIQKSAFYKSVSLDTKKGAVTKGLSYTFNSKLTLSFSPGTKVLWTHSPLGLRRLFPPFLSVPVTCPNIT